MGSAASAKQLKDERSKPIDASDVSTFRDAKAEIVRMREVVRLVAVPSSPGTKVLSTAAVCPSRSRTMMVGTRCISLDRGMMCWCSPRTTRTYATRKYYASAAMGNAMANPSSSLT